MKNLKLFFILAILSYPVYNAISAAPTAEYHPKGDLDSNGMVNSNDLNILNKIISGQWQEVDCDANNACGCFCDVNGDGVCDEKDVDDMGKMMNTGYKAGYSARLDFNKDYLIDYEDLIVFNRDWDRKNCRIGNFCDCACDVNADGRCDEADFDIFSQHYKYPTGLDYAPKYDYDLDGKIDEKDQDIFNRLYGGALGQAGCHTENIRNCSCDFNSDGKCDLLDSLDLNSRVGSAAKENYDINIDFNLDYAINEEDLDIFNNDWNRSDCAAENSRPCVCDLNHDGACDLADFEMFRPYYDPITNLGYEPKFDLNSSGAINAVDYGIFMDVYRGNLNKKTCEAYNDCVCSCDFNGDGACDLYDVIEFKKRENTQAKTGKYWARIDYNKDYVINSADVAIFDTDWRREDCDPGNFCDCECDLNDDGKCGLADIEIFSQYYNVNDHEEEADEEGGEIEDNENENMDEYSLAALDLYSGNAVNVLEKINEKADSTREIEAKIKYLDKLSLNTPAISRQALDGLMVFLAYGADLNTKNLGAGERAAVIHSFAAAFSRLPGDQKDLTDAIRIANGRWPGQTSADAEFKANAYFRKIYLRIADMDDPRDNAAITIMAYGLRQKPENRNLVSEKTGIKTFKHIYGHHPLSTEDWNILQAITYSGAAR